MRIRGVISRVVAGLNSSGLTRRWYVGYAAALGAVTLVSLFIGLVLGQVNLANVSMLYLLAVMATAVGFGRGPAVFASVLAFLIFDWFFVQPLHHLTVADPVEWVSLVFFLLTAIVTGQLAAGQRQRAREAQQREREAVVLYDVLRLFEFYYPKEKWEFDVAVRDLARSRDIVEIGCGPGLFLEHVRSTYRDARVRGLELNGECVRSCRERGFDVEQRSIEAFAEKAEKSVDAVCSFQVLEHAASPGTFLAAAFRCLRPGGIALISVPNSVGFLQRFAVNAMLEMPPHHVTRWTADVMRHAAEAHGMLLERVVEEPVAEYHKESYRTVLTVRAISALLGLRWRRLERGLPYRLLLALCYRLQRVLPAFMWRYTRHPGHTLYVAFRKPA